MRGFTRANYCTKRRRGLSELKTKDQNDLELRKVKLESELPDKAKHKAKPKENPQNNSSTEI